MIWKAHTRKARAGFPPSIMLAEAPVSSPEQVCLQQLLCDGERRPVAHMLGFGKPGLGELIAPQSANQSASLIAEVFAASVLGVPQGLPIFIPVSSDAISADFVDLVPRDKIVLELEVDGSPRADFVARLAELQERGFRLALRSANAEPTVACYQHASYAIVELGSQRAARIDAQLEVLSRLPLKTIARGIRSTWQLQAALMRGFDWFQGDHLGPTIALGAYAIEPDATVVMRAFNLVAVREDIAKIEEVIKHDAALCYRLLCFVNAAGFGSHYRVESIRHALSVVGYDDMLKLLGLFSFAGVREHANVRGLLNRAASRGRLVELLGQHAFSSRERGHAYLIGMFSLLDRILGIPLEQALQNLNLAAPISETLLNDHGRFAPYLRLALALENQHLKEAELHARELGFDFDYACRTHVSATHWARNAA